MIIFLCVPMRGKSIGKISRDAYELKRKAQLMFSDEYKQLIFINGHENNYNIPDGANKQVYIMSKIIEKLSIADLVVAPSEWRDYKGCKIEHDIAVAYGVDFMEL